MHSYQGIFITFDEMGKKNERRAQLGLKSLTKSINQYLEFVRKEIEDFSWRIFFNTLIPIWL